MRKTQTSSKNSNFSDSSSTLPITYTNFILGQNTMHSINEKNRLPSLAPSAHHQGNLKIASMRKTQTSSKNSNFSDSSFGTLRITKCKSIPSHRNSLVEQQYGAAARTARHDENSTLGDLSSMATYHQSHR